MNIETLIATLAGTPALPGARCRGRHHLFDEAAHTETAETVTARHQQALGLCERCPSLTRCGDWLESLPPSKRPPGVIAGRVRRPRPVGRPRAAS